MNRIIERDINSLATIKKYLVYNLKQILSKAYETILISDRYDEINRHQREYHRENFMIILGNYQKNFGRDDLFDELDSLTDSDWSYIRNLDAIAMRLAKL